MRNILIADSASIVQFVLDRILGKEGYVVHYTKHPRDFVQQVQSVQPDLIFLEAEIGGGRGYRICEYLARRPETKGIPIVLTTRVADPDQYDFNHWPGVIKVLRKPLSSQQVLEVVQQLPERREMSGEDRESEAM
ncbi:MAG: response regulator [Acidobacteria bacterium]|nr:response regulator [Acidobacteriota bacterium]MCB9398829.1 response regulator [Acidobacteriota bacterium]